MIVAITGGTGFIGRHLISRCLAAGYTVRVLSRREASVNGSITWYRGNLEDQSCLLSFIDGVDVLYHCAGQLTDESSMRSLHVDGTGNLIAAASGKIKHWVQLSSVGVYGAIAKGEITEDFPPNPIGEYEITKAESDNLVISAAKQGKFTYSILRPSNVFAADMTNQSLFSMFKMIERGLFFFIGPKGASANYIHVDNVVAALLLCGEDEHAKGKIFNISDYCTMEELVEVITETLFLRSRSLSVPELPIRWIARLMGMIPGFPLNESRVNALTNRSRYSIERIQVDLGYMHCISMQEGLQKLLAAYKNS